MVPRIQVNGGGAEGEGGGSLVQTLLALLVSERGDALLGAEEVKPQRKAKGAAAGQLEAE